MVTAKGKAGFIGLFGNHAAYERWNATEAQRGKCMNKMLDICGMNNDDENPRSGLHRELKRARTKRSETAVQKTIDTFNNCYLNPWEIPNQDIFYCLASGNPVSSEIP